MDPAAQGCAGRSRGRRLSAAARKYGSGSGGAGGDSVSPDGGLRFDAQAVGIASEWRANDFRLYLHDYYRMVEAVDGEVGKVLAALRDAGLESNTVVIFASDHGEGVGGHRWVQKASFYEESVRVPFMIAGPGVGSGVRRELTTLADVVPTMCGLAGIGAPVDMRGVNVCAPFERPFVVSEVRYENAGREGRMSRTPRYKYIRFNSGERPDQLFDLQADRGETVNLARSADSLLEEHRRLLKQWMSDTNDALPRCKLVCD